MNTDHVELLGRAHIPLSEKEMIGFGKKYAADEEKCQTSHALGSLAVFCQDD